MDLSYASGKEIMVDKNFIVDLIGQLVAGPHHANTNKQTINIRLILGQC